MVILTKANDPVHDMDMEFFHNVYKDVHGVRPRGACCPSTHGEYEVMWAALKAERALQDEQDAYYSECRSEQFGV